MDPQRRFLAATLQGAIDAEVLSGEDIARHVTPVVLATHIPSDLLWGCLVEGMERAGLVVRDSGAMPPSPKLPVPRAAAEAGPLGSGAEPAERAHATSGSIDIDVTDALDELPPLPDDDLPVEDVDWEDSK
jgi:hypothetical protein